MNITKEQADKVIAALEVGRIWAECEKQDRSAKFCNEAITIIRGLAEDAEPVASDSLGQPDNLEVIIDAFIEDYEMVGETEDGRDACHTPTDGERALIKDAICGLLADTDWDNAWGNHLKSLAHPPEAAQTEADELLRKWNLDPDLYRTDSGALNHMKIAAALKHPDDYPHTAQTAVKSESLAQAAQALERVTWQPIETAPKDGTQVMLTNGISVAHGNWLHAEPFIREIRDLEGRYIDQDESDGYDGWIDFIGGMMPEPTLWMPLPTPPESKG